MKKAALITGSSRGIGRAIACKLAQTMPVIINYRNNADAANEVQLQITRNGGEAIIARADVSDYEQVRQMFSSIENAGYWAHTLVNNAGIINDNIAAAMPIDAWRQVVDCNLNGAFYCVKEAIQMMLPRRSGTIINISSTSGLHGQYGQCNYSAAKAGLVGLTKSLAKELGRYNIRVNCVAPGLIETDMISGLLVRGQTAKSVEYAKNELIALRRLGSPDDVANVVEFLVSGKAAYMTGQIIEVDGGLSI